MRLTRLVLATSLGALSACGGSGAYARADTAGAGPMAVADTVTLAGVVETFGVDPMTYPVLRSDGTVLRLEGALAAELGRLVGAGVRVRGLRESANPHDRLTASSYEVVEVNGEPVWVGIIERRDGQLVLHGAHTWRLMDVPEQLGGMVGAKVYVGGVMTDMAIAVRNWGLIRSSP